MNIHVVPPPDEDTIAAIAAVLAAYVAETPAQGSVAPQPRSAWAAAGRLEAQGLPPTRAVPLGWAAAERARHAARWSSGIVGL